LLALPTSYYLFVIAVFSIVFSRYLLVPLILLTPFAGVAISRMLSLQGARLTLAMVVVATAFATQIALVANLNLTLIGDSRYAMARWIENNVIPGSTIETYVRQRLLPHVSEDHQIVVVGNSSGAFNRLEVPEELTARGLADRQPDYVLVLRDIGVTGDPDEWVGDSLQRYYSELVGGKLGYHVVAEIRTPRLFPFRQIPGTGPTALMLARSTNVADNPQP
jgi:hypothetical protein